MRHLSRRQAQINGLIDTLPLEFRGSQPVRASSHVLPRRRALTNLKASFSVP